MKLKKLLAVLCACALVFALAIPAFATAITNGTSTEFEGSEPEGTIAVKVLTSSTPKLYVNPYGLPFTPNDVTLAADSVVTSSITIKGETTTDGLFSTPAVIRNSAATALNVSVTMTTTEKGNVKVVASAPTTTPANNTLYGSFEITDATVASGVLTPKWADKKSVPIPAGSGTANQAGTPVTASTGYTLPAATVTTGMGGTTSTTPTYAAFRLVGSAVLGASDASGGNATAGNVSSWTTADVANVTVAFSFTPAS